MKGFSVWVPLALSGLTPVVVLAYVVMLVVLMIGFFTTPLVWGGNQVLPN